MDISKQHIATFLAILFHVSGFIGIVYSSHKDWFIANTPFNLCLMALLLLWNQRRINISFLLFVLISFVTGMGVEMIGVNTGKLFGNYTYGNILGPALNGVPWLIGLNWWVVIFCSGAIMTAIHHWFAGRFEEAEQSMGRKMKTFSLIIDGALLATFFDWIMEPVAIKLGFWKWHDTAVPFYNYTCWFLISTALLLVYRLLPFQKENHFAVHLFIIQTLFFLALSIYL